MPDAPEGWSNDIPNINVKPYTEDAGPKCNLPFDAPELDFLMCIIGENFFERIARSTNLYAASTRPPAEPDASDEFATSDRAWTPTDSHQMKAFFGHNHADGSCRHLRITWTVGRRTRHFAMTTFPR